MARTAMLAVGALWTLAGAAPQLNAQPLCVIQGSGPESPLAGSNVTTAGVVTADFSGAGLAGFFIQDPGCDSDPDTSDAVWVSALAIKLAESTDAKKIRGVLPTAFGLYRGMSGTDLSVDNDGIRLNMKYARQVYTNGSLVDYQGK